MRTDVVVVGSGAAGLVAALHAAMRGAKVVVLERAPVFGGTSAVSGSAQWLPGNPLGKAFGLHDSQADVEAYLDSLTLGQIRKSVLLAFIREAPLYFDFLAGNTACEIEPYEVPDYYQAQPGSKGAGRTVAIGLYDTHRLGEYEKLLRMPYWPGGLSPVLSSEDDAASRGRADPRALYDLAIERRAKGLAARGRALIGGLMEACLKHGVVLVHNVRATRLTQVDGRVTGVHAVRDGTDETYEAKAGVVLASGGFEWNRALWNGLVGLPFDGPLSPPYNEGDGLRMSMAAGARLGNVNQAWWFVGGVQVPGETYDGKMLTRYTAAATRTGSITVNRRGRRFMNENMPYNEGGKVVTYFDPLRYEFPNYPAFCVMDRAAFESGPLLLRDFTTVPDARWLFEAKTVRGLAERMGVDPEGLDKEVTDYNRAAEHGVDPVFHRGDLKFDLIRGALETARVDTTSGLKNPMLRPIGTGPYYALQLKVTCFGTKGGPVIDDQARVLGFDDQPIPGLFAAGNVTASVFGPAYPGGGGTLAAGATFGYIAGRTATSSANDMHSAS